MDGGSSDDTLDIIRKYDNRITFWESKSDRGQTHAINKGIQKATGDVITWLNSDDYYLPGILKDIDKIYQKENFEFLAGTVRLVDLEGNKIQDLKPKWPSVEKKLYSINPYIGQPASFFTRKAINRVGLLEESFKYAMDFDFWLRLRRKRVEFHLTDEVFTCFRQHEESKTSDGPLAFVYELFEYYSKPEYMVNSEVRHMIGFYSKILMNSEKYRQLKKVRTYYFLFNPGQSYRIARNKLLGIK